MSKESLNKIHDQNRNEVQLRGDQSGRPGLSYNFRDVIATGIAIPTLAQESTVLSGVAATFLDLIQVSVANASTVAQVISLRSGTGGTVLDTIAVPAGDTVEKRYIATLPSSEKAQAWTAQNVTGGEISDSPVTVQLTAVKNV